MTSPANPPNNPPYTTQAPRQPPVPAVQQIPDHFEQAARQSVQQIHQGLSSYNAAVDAMEGAPQPFQEAVQQAQPQAPQPEDIAYSQQLTQETAPPAAPPSGAAFLGDALRLTFRERKEVSDTFGPITDAIKALPLDDKGELTTEDPAIAADMYGMLAMIEDAMMILAKDKDVFTEWCRDASVQDMMDLYTYVAQNMNTGKK